MESLIKKIALVVAAAIFGGVFFCGCDRVYEYDVDHYILQYSILKRLYVCPLSQKDSVIILYGKTHEVTFRSGNAKDKALYDSLCFVNNDMSYSGPTDLICDMIDSYRECCSPNMASIEVTSNKDYDESHPAGTSLNDCITIEFQSAYEYINSGYQEKFKPENKYKSLAEVTADELQMITDNCYGYISFTTKPTILDVHYITITLTSQEGEVFQDRIRYDFANINKEFVTSFRR